MFIVSHNHESLVVIAPTDSMPLRYEAASKDTPVGGVNAT